MIRLLLVEDDRRIADALAAALQRSDYDVTLAGTGAEALVAAPADLVLLDLGLPDIDGLEVCRRLRAVGDVPIIAVTARGQAAERVEGLRTGADDYIVKPFSMAELFARIEAVLRRTGLATERLARIEVGDLVVDQQSHQVTVGGRPIHLARKEYELLAVLAAVPGQVFSRSDLLLEVWHTAWEGTSRTVDVHVGLIRQKTGRPELIRTVHGVGYVIPEG